MRLTRPHVLSLALALATALPGCGWLGANEVPLLLAYESAAPTSEVRPTLAVGDHCPRVDHTLDPPRVTLRDADGGANPLGEALVIRDGRGTMPFVGVGPIIEAVHVRDGVAWLEAPFREGGERIEVRLVEGAFLVNDSRIAPGESAELRVVDEILVDGAAHEIPRTLRLEHAGDARVRYERALPCD